MVLGCIGWRELRQRCRMLQTGGRAIWAARAGLLRYCWYAIRHGVLCWKRRECLEKSTNRDCIENLNAMLFTASGPAVVLAACEHAEQL